MRRIIATLIVALVGLQANPTRAHVERKHAIDVGEVWKSVGDQPDPESAQREQVLRVLQHPTTREIARAYGLDLKAAEDAVQVLDGAELEQLSARAAIAESSLSGGDTFVITSTTIIIILLIVILIIVI